MFEFSLISNKCKIYYFRIIIFFFVVVVVPPYEDTFLSKLILNSDKIFWWNNLKKFEEGVGAGQTKIQMPTIYIAKGATFEMNKQVGDFLIMQQHKSVKVNT